MRLITVRHGRTACNDSGVTQGWSESELSELDDGGLRQAEKVAERLKEEKIDVIYSSDLKRASRTAEEIVKFHDCELIFDERLREQNKGKYQMGPEEELWKDFRESGEGILEWIPEGGESMGNVKKRVMDFLNEVRGRYKNKTVLVVSHGGALGIISRHFHNDVVFDGIPDGKSAKLHKHGNTSVSEYVFDGEKWNVVRTNCVEHLG